MSLRADRPRARRPFLRSTTVAAAAVVLLSSLGVVVAEHPGFASQQVGFSAEADTYVSAAYPDRAFGTADAMKVDASPVRRSYVRFTVAGTTAPTSVELQVLSRTGARSISVSTTGTAWDERTLTMHTAPAVGTLVGSAGATAKGGLAKIDVTSAVTGAGTYAFVLTTSSTNQQGWGTKEGGQAAQLVVTTADPAAPTTTSTSTTSTSTTSATTSTTTAPTTTTTTAPAGGGTTDPASSTLPLRAAFYYPWFPEAWNQGGISPYTWYHPTPGLYDESNLATLSRQIGDLQYAGMQAGIASWWGQGSRTDNRIAPMLQAAAGTGFKWSLYYENESTGDPTVSQIDSDLTYVATKYASDPGFLHLNGKPVIFVYADGADGCGMADRWMQANSGRFYVVLKVFSGYKLCASQPDWWHQYAPAVRSDSQKDMSFSVSPGFYLRSESTPRLARDPAAFTAAVQAMAASNAPMQLVTTFNEWGEGTAVESAQEWSSFTGEGTYLDILHDNLGGAALHAPDPVIAAVGDISCDPADANFNAGAGSSNACHMKSTSDIVPTMPNLTAVLTLGDEQYDSGTLDSFNQSYGPTWGRWITKTLPVPGNHEYVTPQATGYYQYFGLRGGDPTKGYYSFDLGQWHIVALNGNCSEVNGCDAASPQVAWLVNDLATHPSKCTLAYWHQPRWSSGHHGSDPTYDAMWRALQTAGVDVVLNGHDHTYERFAPQTPDGVPSDTGIREFVVGTGGRNLYSWATLAANSEVRNNATFGLLQLSLHAGSYDWQFLPEAGKTFTDTGTSACH